MYFLKIPQSKEPECHQNHAYLQFAQLCLNLVGELDVLIQSCGRTQGIDLTETEEGLISEDGAIYDASMIINLHFVARVNCKSDADSLVLLARFEPGIEIYQSGTQVCTI